MHKKVFKKSYQEAPSTRARAAKQNSNDVDNNNADNDDDNVKRCGQSA